MADRDQSQSPVILRFFRSRSTGMIHITEDLPEGRNGVKSFCGYRVMKGEKPLARRAVRRAPDHEFCVRCAKKAGLDRIVGDRDQSQSLIGQASPPSAGFSIRVKKPQPLTVPRDRFRVTFAHTSRINDLRLSVTVWADESAGEVPEREARGMLRVAYGIDPRELDHVETIKENDLS